MTDLEDRIRAALEHRAATTRITTGATEPGAPSPPAATATTVSDTSTAWSGSLGRWRWVPLAAAAVLVVGGVVGVATWRQSPPPAHDTAPSVPSPWDIDIDDPDAITLDAWIRPATEDAPGGQRYLALDPGALPDGLSIASESSSTTILGLIDDSENQLSYRYRAVLAVDGVDAFEVRIDDGRRDAPPPMDCDALAATEFITVELNQRIELDGVTAMTDGSTVCWSDPDGHSVLVIPIDPDLDTSGQDELTGPRLAERVSVITVDQLPRSRPAAGTDEPDQVDLAGQLAGVRWAADVVDGPLRTMFFYVNGAKVGGFENTRDSQPDDDPVTSIQEDTIFGVPGFGVIVSGIAPPEIARVIVHRADGETARLPVLQRDNESVFALPVPDTVHVRSVEFVTNDGRRVAVLEVPELPIGLDGGYTGWLTPATADTRADSTDRSLPTVTPGER